MAMNIFLPLSRHQNCNRTIQTRKNKLSPELFAEFLEKQEYSIRYNQITHNFEFFGFNNSESKKHLAENVPTILQDQFKLIYTHVSKQNIIDYITRYATRHKYNPVLSSIQDDGLEVKIYLLPFRTLSISCVVFSEPMYSNSTMSDISPLGFKGT